MSNARASESVSQAVISFIQSARYEDFPQEAIALAKRCVIDGLGVMLAGSTQPAGQILYQYLDGTDKRQDATVYGKQIFKTSAAAAALSTAPAVMPLTGMTLSWQPALTAFSAC